MPVIKVQKVPRKQLSTEDMLARFCYHFPQYTFHEARQLPYKRIVQFLKVARQEQAKEWYNLARAIAAPHSKRGEALKSLFSELKEIIES